MGNFLAKTADIANRNLVERKLVLVDDAERNLVERRLVDDAERNPVERRLVDDAERNLVQRRLVNDAERNLVQRRLVDDAERNLVDLVFSWSLKEVLSKDLYRDKVRRIPDTFLSAHHYLTAFIHPLVEETHADLSSSMTALARAPVREVISVEITKGYQPPKDLFYEISLKGYSGTTNKSGMYEPENGDVIAFTDVRPKSSSDLDGPKRPYVIALVQGSTDESSNRFRILSSKHIECFGQEIETDKRTETEDYKRRETRLDKKKPTLFAVFLINMTTNLRIWNALHMGQEKGKMTLIQKVLQPDHPAAENTCSLCLSSSASVWDPTIRPFKLNDSQHGAVSSCLAARKCDHENSVKLIWGPPGTGKTKTVGVLLFLLLRMKCRTVTCAPTNIAVVEVTTRLTRLVRESMECGSYGLGDILIFGNGKRMKIDEHDDLLDVYLDFRTNVLVKCFAPLSGWKHSVKAMISLLEDPEEMYQNYMKEIRKEDEKDDDEEEEEETVETVTEAEERILRDEKLVINSQREGKIHPQYFEDVKSTKMWRNVIEQTLKKNKKSFKGNIKQQLRSLPSKENAKLKYAEGKHNRKKYGLLTFQEFVKKRFGSIRIKLKFCIINLYTHLPTSLITVEAAKDMIKVLGLLESIATLLHIRTTSFDRLNQNFEDNKGKGKLYGQFELHCMKQECLQTLRSLLTLPVPTTFSHDEVYDEVQNFCLSNATLIFCTASSSAKLHRARRTPFELLVIDEAAQLKECESAIPLQLPGLRHAVLIGDELQLPAMVKSKISADAEFGRSLFERLVSLGQRKHLLDIQYRMHPSISLFPNQEFYNNRILDAANVKDKSYKRCFLRGNMYGSYSFINLAYGEEEKGNSNSTRNMVEVAAISEMVSRLFKESLANREKVSVGIISPYNAQVYAIQEKLGKTYSTSTHSDFSVSVRSVDGFQGGEEDVIIISTVRNNLRGNVGFLFNRQRANVALTRARHCLWILGHGATLENSGTIWAKLVSNAKDRNCFYNVEDDKNLAEAIATSLVEHGKFHLLQGLDLLLFGESRWRVCFSDDFWKSLAKIRSTEISKEVLHLVGKLSNGWRIPNNEKIPNSITGICSELLQVYKVNGLPLHALVWTTDIVKENSNCIQVLKVWDILPRFETPKLAGRLNTLLGNYTVSDINRCKVKCREGDLEVPMTWGPGNMINAKNEDDDFMSRPFASLKIRDESD